MQYAKKRDDNEKAIVKHLRGMGAFVQYLSEFDLLVGYKGNWHPIEVKQPKGKLTKRQVKLIFDLDNKAKFHVVTTIEEAVEIVFGKH